MVDKDRQGEDLEMLVVNVRRVAFYSSPSIGCGEFGTHSV
jgi:hypothetical protein